MAKTPPKTPTKDDKKKKAPDATAASGAATEAAGAPQAPAGDAPPEQPIGINAQFIKDLSFEVPGAPAIYTSLQDKQPTINLSFNVSTNPLQEKVFEVILEIQAECKIEDQVAYIFELEYAGIFTLNVPEEHIHPILLIECPRLLFPFARNILADVTRDGGFSPLMLGPVDFAGMFQAKIQEMEKAKAEGGGAEPNPPA
jgi:preprotein translocase subunit SecB